jgi:hypothetical protein
MPRDGSLTLSDIREPTLTIGCERCGRHGRYNIARLIAAHGADAKITAPRASTLCARHWEARSGGDAWVAGGSQKRQDSAPTAPPP